jgi:hypothetical protein
MANIFQKVRVRKPKSNVFNLSHNLKLSTNMGVMTPILCVPVVPRDRFKDTTEIFVRFAPMLAPLMHSVKVYTHFFFVPNRIAMKQDQWEEFITKGEDGTSTQEIPYTTVAALNSAGLWTVGGLADYFGLPVQQPVVGNDTTPISLLPFLAYQKIWNDYYRDQNLQGEVVIDDVDGGLVTESSVLRNIFAMHNRAWEKDYFTSALPFVQRGDPTVIGLGDRAEVFLENQNDRAQVFRFIDGSTDGYKAGAVNALPNSIGDSIFVPADSPTNKQANIDPNGTLFADLSQATAIDVVDLRTANKVQEWKEKNSRFGSRYIEQILAHFGVKSSDARLQRPEYLGGGFSDVVFDAVFQTSQTTENSPLADYAGQGASAQVTHQFNRFFEEHGYIIGIMTVMPKTGYYQGVPRDFMKIDSMDWYWPSFAHLAEQPIFNSELYVGTNQTNPQGTFGYTPRYAEYKYMPDRVAGHFRTDLDYWHLAREFSTPPQLNGNFIECKPSTRIFNVTDETVEHLYCQVRHNLLARRPMPKYGTPYW